MALTPRDRLLATASELFYAEGIHAVGVDRLVAQAHVTRATFYRHFASKDQLVAAYLAGTHDRLRRLVDGAGVGGPPHQAVLAVLDLDAQDVSRPGFRGCPFINAAAEYPDLAHPVRQVIDRHRTWFRDRLKDLAGAAGHPDPVHAAAVLLLLHDGALSGGELDDPQAVTSTLRRAVGDVFAVAMGQSGHVHAPRPSSARP